MEDSWKQVQAAQIGRNIREKRKAMGLTQSDLAAGHCSVQTVSLIERGKLKITPEMLSSLADRLHCDVDDLLLMHDLQEDWLEDLLQTALTHYEERRLANALEALHRLYTEALSRNNITYMWEASSRLCLLYNTSSKFNISLEWGQIALGHLAPETAPDRVLNLYITLGNNYYVLGQMWDAFDLLREAERLVDPVSSLSEHAGRLYHSMAIIKMMLQNWEGCIWYAERALHIFEQIDMVLYIGRSHMLLGTSFKNQKRYEKARQHIEHSIRILGQTSDLTSFARCHHNLGELEYEMGHWDRARKSYQRALKLKRQAQDHASVHTTLRMLAKLSIEEGRLEESHQLLKECLDRAEKLDSPLQLAKTWQYLGDLAFTEGNEAEFIEYYKRAIRSFEKVGFSSDLAEAAQKLGEYYLEHGKEHAAVPYLRTATRHYRKLLNQF